MISILVYLVTQWWRNACFHTDINTLDHMVFECNQCGKRNIHGYGWK